MILKEAPTAPFALPSKNEAGGCGEQSGDGVEKLRSAELALEGKASRF